MSYLENCGEILKRLICLKKEALWQIIPLNDFHNIFYLIIYGHQKSLRVTFTCLVWRPIKPRDKQMDNESLRAFQ